MTEQEFGEILHEALVLYIEEGGILAEIATYEQKGFLSTHGGRIVRLKNGETFNLMILKDVAEGSAERRGAAGGGDIVPCFGPIPSGTGE